MKNSEEPRIHLFSGKIQIEDKDGHEYILKIALVRDTKKLYLIISDIINMNYSYP